jgi:hypothetical protein
MQIYIIGFYVLKVFWHEDDPVWLQNVAEINTTDNTVLLTALYTSVL